MEQKQLDKLKQARAYLNSAAIVLHEVWFEVDNDFENLKCIIDRDRTNDEDPKAQVYDLAEQQRSVVDNIDANLKSALSLLNRLI